MLKVQSISCEFHIGLSLPCLQKLFITPSIFICVMDCVSSFLHRILKLQNISIGKTNFIAQN